MKNKKIPLRTCVVTKEKLEKKQIPEDIDYDKIKNI